MDDYADALRSHLEEQAPFLTGYHVDTVYFGGGTPSYYGARRLIELWDELKASGSVLRDCEVTVEV